MTEKKGINSARVLAGGIVAGITLFVSAGIVSGGILRSDFENWVQGMGGLIHPLPQPISIMLWITMSLIQGIAGVWIYAGLLSRYGQGPVTALLSGLLIWFAGKLAVALDFIALGIFPARILAGELIGSFVGIVLGVYLGARVYRD